VPPIPNDMRPTIVCSRPAQKEHPSILAVLSFPQSSSTHFDAILSHPHGAERRSSEKSSLPKAFRSIKPSRCPLRLNRALNTSLIAVLEGVKRGTRYGKKQVDTSTVLSVTPLKLDIAAFDELFYPVRHRVADPGVHAVAEVLCTPFHLSH
jgi:hypothetical protein